MLAGMPASPHQIAAVKPRTNTLKIAQIQRISGAKRVVVGSTRQLTTRVSVDRLPLADFVEKVGSDPMYLRQRRCGRTAVFAFYVEASSRP
jgi:hypothetical protein